MCNSQKCALGCKLVFLCSSIKRRYNFYNHRNASVLYLIFGIFLYSYIVLNYGQALLQHMISQLQQNSCLYFVIFSNFHLNVYLNLFDICQVESQIGFCTCKEDIMLNSLQGNQGPILVLLLQVSTQLYWSTFFCHGKPLAWEIALVTVLLLSFIHHVLCGICNYQERL